MPGTRFKVPTKKGDHLFTQQELNFGAKLKEDGIKQAVDHADAEEFGWSEKAYAYLLEYLKGKSEEFMAEEVRVSSDKIVSAPPSNRAWGGVMLRALKAGLIRKTGFGLVKNAKAHQCLATTWIRV